LTDNNSPNRIYPNEHWLGISSLLGGVLFFIGLIGVADSPGGVTTLGVLMIGLFLIHFSQSKGMENRIKWLEKQAEAGGSPSASARKQLPVVGEPHPVLENPHLYDVVDFHYKTTDADGEPYLDLHLAQGDDVCHLRFWSPVDLEIESSFPAPTRGMVILDISHHQIPDVAVRVGDREASWGAITFWARKAENMSAPPITVG
jgi:hypothetical protein